MDISAYPHMNIRMSTRGKRPLRNLTPNDKVRAIQRIHNGETKASVSRDIGVPESTLRGWCKNEQKLRFMCRQIGSEPLSISVLENPPEKRTKLDSEHLALGGMNFALNSAMNNANGHSTNAILEKIALSEFLKKNNYTDFHKSLIGSAHLSDIGAMATQNEFGPSPVAQNLNMFSLLNPNLAPLNPGLGTGSKLKIPLRTSINDDFERKDIIGNNASLSVKNWAKDPFENENRNCINDSKITSSNDTNNNNVKPKPLFPANDIFSLASQAPFNGMPLNIMQNSDQLNGNMIDWCKAFNASFNFLALVAAASAFRPTSAQQSTADASDESTNSNVGSQQKDEDILYRKLAKIPTLNGFSIPNCRSDNSNDSYESEPEDLSIRSTLSKISSPSPANSRSESPAKSNDFIGFADSPNQSEEEQ